MLVAEGPRAGGAASLYLRRALAVATAPFRVEVRPVRALQAADPRAAAPS